MGERITNRPQLINALWDFWGRIDPIGYGFRGDYTEEKAAKILKVRLQALIDSDFGAKTKPQGDAT